MQVGDDNTLSISKMFDFINSLKQFLFIIIAVICTILLVISNNQSISQSLYFQDQQDYHFHLHEENQENQMNYKYKTNGELNLTENVFISLGNSHILDRLQESSLSCIVFF